MSEGRPQLASRCSHCFAPSIPRDIGAARARVKPINFQMETLPAVRKKAVFGPQSADNFSELSLMEKTLPLPFDAEFVRWVKENEEARRLTTIPLIRAIVASP